MRILLIGLIIGIIYCLDTPAEPEKIFNIYTDKDIPDNHYSPTGWIGDFGDINLNEQYMKHPYSGTSCIEIEYSAKKSQGEGWAGVYWQNPPNNWGKQKGGFDLSGFNKLTFRARGKKGGEAIEKFKVGGIKGDYPDSLDVEIGPVVLTKDWRQYSINLAGEDLSYVSGGLCWVINSRLNPRGATFYLDEIRFEYQEGLQADVQASETMPFDVYSERSSAANHFVPSGWMGDYGDLKIDEAWSNNPHSGSTCIKVEYSAKASQGVGWAGMSWQHPADNWGQVSDAGFDLSAASKLSFWAKGEKGAEAIKQFKMGGIKGDYPDSDVAGIGPVKLTDKWQQFSIDLSDKELSYIIGGFGFSVDVKANPQGCIFYLDDIRYE